MPYGINSNSYYFSLIGFASANYAYNTMQLLGDGIHTAGGVIAGQLEAASIYPQGTLTRAGTISSPKGIGGYGYLLASDQAPSGYAIVNTSGTSVTWVSGITFTTGSSWNNTSILIAGVTYKISSVSSSTALILTSSAGTQTGVALNLTVAQVDNPLISGMPVSEGMYYADQVNHCLSYYNGTSWGCVGSVGGGAVSSVFGQTGAVPNLSGDASTSNSSLVTFATVNSAPGSCGDATHVCQETVNAKGLVTAQAPVAITAGAGNWTLSSSLLYPNSTSYQVLVGLSADDGSGSALEISGRNLSGNYNAINAMGTIQSYLASGSADATTPNWQGLNHSGSVTSEIYGSGEFGSRLGLYAMGPQTSSSAFPSLSSWGGLGFDGGPLYWFWNSTSDVWGNWSPQGASHQCSMSGCSGGRAYNTVYQNTNSTTMKVAVTIGISASSAGASALTDTGNPPTTSAGFLGYSAYATGYGTLTFDVLPNSYYEVTTSGTVSTLPVWMEWW